MFDEAAVFFDLHGTLGNERGHISSFAFYDCSISAIKLINKAELPAVIITNQEAIAKGDFSCQYFEERMTALQQEVEKAGARIDAVYYCPHGPQDGCECRKPKPGLVLAARKDLSLDFNKCYFVGDTGVGDMTLAHSIGCKKILVRTGFGESSLAEYRHTWANITPDLVVANVFEAAEWIAADRRLSSL